MQTAIIDKARYIELMRDPKAEHIFRRNMMRLIEEHGLVREKYADQLKVLAAFLELSEMYAEQVMHGHPVFRDARPVCEKFGVSLEAMFAEGQTAIAA